MDLPLVDEIREARRLAEEAQLAELHYKRVQAALSAVHVLQRKLDAMASGTDVELPASDLVDELAERWPSLADLSAVGPRPTEDPLEKLQARRTQLESAAQLLAPLARESSARSDRLAHLQHEQQHRLDDPRYAEAVAELQRIGTERERIRLRLEPLKMKLVSIDPANLVLGSFVAHLDRELEFPASSRVPGGVAWRAAVVARNLAEATRGLLDQLNLEIASPEVPTVPDAPTAEQGDALLAEARRVRDELERLLAAVHGEHQSLSSRQSVLQERYDALTQSIVDRLG